jgi:hypothetical protein
MPLTEDQHPVGDLCPGGEHEPFRVSVRARTSGRDLHGLDIGKHLRFSDDDIAQIMADGARQPVTRIRGTRR